MKFKVNNCRNDAIKLHINPESKAPEVRNQNYTI